jgi:acetyl esterase/lipase
VSPSLGSRFFRVVWRRVTRQVETFGSIQEARASMEQVARWSFLPRGVRREVVTVDGLPAEWLIPTRETADGVWLYLHGGAWTLGWNPAHRWLAAHLARATGLRLLALDYRLAPEFPYPAALDDCLAVYRWLLRQGIPPERLIIGGDSAGGNLTLTTMLALREAGQPLPRAALCLSPATDLARRGETAVSDDAGLPVNWGAEQIRSYLGHTDPRLPLVSPTYADLSGLPPLLIQAGGDEWLRHDAERLAQRARNAGVDVTLQVWPGMWHVFQILVPFMRESREAVAAIAAFVGEQVNRNT